MRPGTIETKSISSSSGTRPVRSSWDTTRASRVASSPSGNVPCTTNAAMPSPSRSATPVSGRIRARSRASPSAPAAPGPKRWPRSSWRARRTSASRAASRRALARTALRRRHCTSTCTRAAMPSSSARRRGTSRGPSGCARMSAAPRSSMSPTSFFQTNVRAAEILVQQVLAAVPAGASVLDLYAGAGLFALPLALRGHTVVAIEENRSAVADGEASLRLSRVPRGAMPVHREAGRSRACSRAAFTPAGLRRRRSRSAARRLPPIGHRSRAGQTRPDESRLCVLRSGVAGARPRAHHGVRLRDRLDAASGHVSAHAAYRDGGGARRSA